MKKKQRSFFFLSRGSRYSFEARYGEIKLRDYKLDQWRLMHIGAQPVPPAVVKHWKEYFPKMQYDTNYGLSESTGPGCIHLGIEMNTRLELSPSWVQLGKPYCG